jgi:hypothetical protein
MSTSSPVSAPLSEEQMCIHCRGRKSEHIPAGGGSLMCPPRTVYFTPCTHQNRQGFGTLGSDGKATVESTCTFCGGRFKW